MLKENTWEDFIMKGILLSIDFQNKSGKVDTRNDQLGILNIYFKKIPENIQNHCTVEFELVTSQAGNKYAKFLSVVDRNKTIFNTEEREKWYVHGENAEQAFISKIVPSLNINLQINPEKSEKPWVIDFYDYTHNNYADLKTQNTPFFSAGKYKYNNTLPYDPSYTVTFNKKDYLHYKQNYPNCDIYFWINWMQLSYKQIKVSPVYGVWKAPFQKLSHLIETNKVALHTYQNRKNDDHNAKESYLFYLLDNSIFEKLL